MASIATAAKLLNQVKKDTMKKERSDMILEPLQVMIQLALLSYSPVGSKVSVSGNLLKIQQPTLLQGAWRWYNADNKDDLYYLFHAIRRYYMWYKSTNTENAIYDYILKCALKGLDKLIITYSQTDKITITHTLSLYRNMLSLDSEKLFSSDDSVNIDTVFAKIKDIYPKRLLLIVHNLLVLMGESKDEKDKNRYLRGMLEILKPINAHIRCWIRENLQC